ncbi:hypothetical protein MMC30_002938 [Trapelia coarctata]|nr:hypothetical protein [Trapelia coarctata]
MGVGVEEASVARRLWATLGLLFVYLLGRAIYNVYWNPLSKYPGPPLWAAFRFPYIISLCRGELVHDIYQTHQKYGDVVRVAPNELSYANKEAWHDIYCFRAGHKPFPKNPIWWGDFPGRTPSIVSTPDHAAHERMRKLLSYCFSVKALNGQEDTVQQHTDLMIHRLRDGMNDSSGLVVNIVEWYMFITFDILGDLGFGESFNCLKRSTLHPWIGTIFNYFRIAAFIGSLRLYTSTSVDSLLMKIVPESVSKISKDNYAWAVEKVHRRMNLETTRQDFMSHILKHNDENGMSIPEIENNTNVLIVAGSETCGTVLSGTTNYLMKSPAAYHKLTDEIRRTFSKEEEMTFAALSHLPYLNAVIEEGLRMSPPSASALQHVVPSGGDTVCGDWLPEGTNLGVHQWSLYRSGTKFHLPNEFIPERWLPASKLDASSPFYDDDLAAVQAFSMGMWSCIGRQLAYGELRVILAKMVWNFDMCKADGGRDVEWAEQKSWFLVEKEPFDVRLVDARS